LKKFPSIKIPSEGFCITINELESHTMKLRQKKLVNVTLTAEEVDILIKTLQPIAENNGKVDTLLTEIKLQTVWRNEKYIE
jgi:hypothetical protein